MIYIILLFIETFVLFLLSRLMSKTLSGFLSINFLSFLFLHGIIINELSHFLMAVILFVPVGNIEFIPKKSGNTVRLGSVKIGKTDPIRRSLIGFAPVFAGLLIIMAIVYVFSSNMSFYQNNGFYVYAIIILVMAYLLFVVSNTMFSSSTDMEGTVEILITLSIIITGAYVLGFRPQLSILDNILTSKIIATIESLLIFLLAPITVDLFILGTIRLFTSNRNRSF